MTPPAVDRALVRRWATDPRLTDAALLLLTTVHLDAAANGQDWAVFGDVTAAWPLSLGALRAAIRRAVWCGWLLRVGDDHRYAAARLVLVDDDAR